MEDILDHAKIESGVFEIHEVKFELRQLFNEVKDIFDLQCERKGIELSFQVHSMFNHLKVMTDKQRLKQVLLNLLSNALKFTDKGSIKISLNIQSWALEERKESIADALEYWALK